MFAAAPVPCCTMGRDGLVRLHSSVETEQLFLKSTNPRRSGVGGSKERSVTGLSASRL